jgi:purine-binding chemotaxis protein CheW
VDILTFELDAERYAFRADRVVQVVQMVAISPLPGAPPVVEGVVNVRGTIVPVFDLRARLNLPMQAIDPSQHLVILISGARQAAVRVDAVEDYVSIPDADITGIGELADSPIGGSGGRLVAGIAATPDGTKVIYDLAAFLSLSESETLDHALAPIGG